MKITGIKNQIYTHLSGNILTILIFTPIVLAIPILFMGERHKAIKYYAFFVSFIVFGISLYVFSIFDSATPNFQMIERHQWVKDFNIFYLLGLDGISLLLILLTTFIFPVTMMGIWGSVNTRVKEFFFLFLLYFSSNQKRFQIDRKLKLLRFKCFEIS